MISRRTERHGVTLVELIVVIAIIGMIISLSMPAIYMARATSRKMACQRNLTQLGTAILERAERTKGQYTTGAFDWLRDGSVVDVGWVADLVAEEIDVGKMLCPSNTSRVNETYLDLLNFDVNNANRCVDLVGSPPRRLADGTTLLNPCRTIVHDPGGILGPGSEARRLLVQERILKEGYNTNYCASWFLVRTGPFIIPNGNIAQRRRNCPRSIRSRNSTYGPMKVRDLDAATIPRSTIPLLGDSSPSTRGTLTHNMGDAVAGETVSTSFTTGPVRTDTLRTPVFPANTREKGPNGWWRVWNRSVLQDYRGFGAVHQACNIFFADGHVGSINDENGDGLINNGFQPIPGSGFDDGTVEVTESELFSRYFLRAQQLN